LADSLNKTALLNQCTRILEEKIHSYQTKISELEFSKSEDTKSSAGDKFETSREMLQQEIDKLTGQLQLQKADLLKINHLLNTSSTSTVGEGSLVITESMTFLIAVSLGKVVIEDVVCYVISVQAPMARAMIGKSVGESFMFNGKDQKVLGIW